MTEEKDFDQAALTPYESYRQLQKIASTEQARDVAQAFVDVKKAHKVVESERKELTKKVLQAKYAIDEKAEKVTKPLSEIAHTLKAALEKWEAAQRAEVVEQKLLEAKKEEDVDRAADMIAFANDAPAFTHRGLRWTKDYDITVEHPHMVPMEYWTIDQVKIKAAIKAGLDIPGITSQLNYKVGVTGK